MKKVAVSFEALEPFFEKIGKLPQLHRVLIAVGAFVLLIGGFGYLSYMPKFQQINDFEQQLEQLEQKLTIMRQQASQIDKYRQQMAEAKDKFQIVKKKLPEEKDIPSLLESISESGQAAGLEFLLFEPLPEDNHGFYAAIPVKIQVEGRYHEVERFLANVAEMNRIVNVHNIVMKPGKERDDLLTSCRAVTYRFIESAGQPSEKK